MKFCHDEQLLVPEKAGSSYSVYEGLPQNKVLLNNFRLPDFLFLADVSFLAVIQFLFFITNKYRRSLQRWRPNPPDTDPSGVWTSRPSQGAALVKGDPTWLRLPAIRPQFPASMRRPPGRQILLFGPRGLGTWPWVPSNRRR